MYFSVLFIALFGDMRSYRVFPLPDYYDNLNVVVLSSINYEHK